jgi:hypothetical protein
LCTKTSGNLIHVNRKACNERPCVREEEEEEEEEVESFPHVLAYTP